MSSKENQESALLWPWHDCVEFSKDTMYNKVQMEER